MGMGVSGAIMGAGSAYSKYQLQKGEAAYEQSAKLYNNKLAQEELVRQNANVMQKMEDSRSIGIESMIENQKAAAQAKGTALAQAGASGTGGGSVDRVMYDINTEAGNNATKIISNHDKQLNAMYTQLESNKAGYLNNVNTTPIMEPSATAAIFDAGKGAITGYQQGSQLQTTWDDFKGGKTNTQALFSLFG